MSLSEKITKILNGTIQSVQSIVPMDLEIARPALLAEPFKQRTTGVLIGITGDILGRILLTGNNELFSKVGESMFGMPVTGEMLESFAGELGNMVVGNLSTIISQQGLTMDITPPTVFVGETSIYGFKKAFHLPIKCDQIGQLEVVLMLEET
ncbi:chemotaxis protein CheX [Bacillus kwashiorkori]|uniref:chemotaxis protein CheX n=1 Tax=Bacillus kwashiorkori TaxID=1522318 RepID=UPI00078625EA|nr:chemotaxis protein CheX [Bacillus kwashiorkori]